MNDSLENWVAGYIIDLVDGASEGRIIHTGSLKSCEDVRRLLLAVAYSGERSVKNVNSFVMRKDDWETL